MLLLYFFKYRAYSRRAPPKPVIDLLFLTTSSLLQLFNQKTAAKKAKLYEAASEGSSLRNTDTTLEVLAMSYEKIQSVYSLLLKVLKAEGMDSSAKLLVSRRLMIFSVDS